MSKKSKYDSTYPHHLANPSKIDEYLYSPKNPSWVKKLMALGPEKFERLLDCSAKKTSLTSDWLVALRKVEDPEQTQLYWKLGWALGSWGQKEHVKQTVSDSKKNWYEWERGTDWMGILGPLSWGMGAGKPLSVGEEYFVGAMVLASSTMGVSSIFAHLLAPSVLWERGQSKLSVPQESVKKVRARTEQLIALGIDPTIVLALSLQQTSKSLAVQSHMGGMAFDTYSAVESIVKCIACVSPSHGHTKTQVWDWWAAHGGSIPEPLLAHLAAIRSGSTDHGLSVAQRILLNYRSPQSSALSELSASVQKAPSIDKWLKENWDTYKEQVAAVHENKTPIFMEQLKTLRPWLNSHPGTGQEIDAVLSTYEAQILLKALAPCKEGEALVSPRVQSI